MTLFNLLPGNERLLPFVLFALYLLTAFRICTYASWRAAGEPNPFLPRSLQRWLARAKMQARCAA